MKRDLARLARETFDVVVVGGGIHGAAAAEEAAARGLATALVEAGDFGGATSANSLKILHGGLRHLQGLDVGKFREAVLARRAILQRFPDLAAPLACVVPTRGLGARSRAAMAAALALNDRLGAERNRGVPERAHLPGGRILSRGELARLAPGLDLAGRSGGALWHDALALDTERLVLRYVLAAAEAGAAVANHLRAERLLARRGRVEGVRVADALGGPSFDVRGRSVIDAAGPWAGTLGGEGAAPLPPTPLVKAVNVVVGRRIFGEAAVGLESPRPGGGSRFFFFVPWRGGTMIGTLYLAHEGAPVAPAAAPREIEELVAEANRLHPAGKIQPGEVRLAHVGLLPALPGDAPAETRLLGRPRLVDGAREIGVAGLVATVGVKYTTGPLVGARAVSLVARTLGRAVPPRRRTPPEEPPGPGEAERVKPELAVRLRGAYGAAARPLLEAIAADPTLGRRLVRGQPATTIEVLHAVREEMALTLADLVFRRTGLGTAGHPGTEALRACAAVAAAELGWDAAQAERELAAVEAEFLRLGARPA